VARALRAEVAGLAEGAQLPPVREMVRRLGASPVTVSQAIGVLAREGLVQARPGAGTFVLRPPRPMLAPALDWQAVSLPPRLADFGDLAALVAPVAAGVLPLVGGYPDPSLQPLRLLTAAAGRAVRKPGAWRRTPTEGTAELRDWFARQASPAARAEDVLVVSGGQAALSTIFRALGRPGDAVVMESPTYLGALGAARAAGLRPVAAPTDTEGVIPELLAEALARSGAKLVYLQPTFANPTGAVLAPARREAVLLAAARARAFVIEDDFARDLALDGRPPPTLVSEDEARVIYLRSLTKSTAPGLRIAGVYARGAAGARLREARIVDDFFVSGMMQELALELVAASGFRRHLAALGGQLRRRRDALLAGLRAHAPELRSWLVPRGGFFLWIALPRGIDEGALVAQAERRGVAVTAGRPWFPAEATGGFVRLSYFAADESLLGEGTRRLGQAVRDLLRGERPTTEEPARKRRATAEKRPRSGALGRGKTKGRGGRSPPRWVSPDVCQRPAPAALLALPRSGLPRLLPSAKGPPAGPPAGRGPRGLAAPSPNQPPAQVSAAPESVLPLAASGPHPARHGRSCHQRDLGPARSRLATKQPLSSRLRSGKRLPPCHSSLVG
jgi:DNA-binding transcriptional MocR family regulator